MRCALTLLLLAIPGALTGASSGPFTEAEIRVMSEIMDAIYRMNFEKAAAISDDLIKKSPEDPMGYVFRARTVWQEELNRKQALSLERFAAPDFFVEGPSSRHNLEADPAVEARFDQVSRDALAKARGIVQADPTSFRAWFLLGMAHQNIATFNASLHGSWRKAFFAGENTRRAHERVFARYPEFDDALVSLAVYDYVAGSVNWFYRMWGTLLGIHGDRKRGLRNLERAAKGGTFLAGDASIMLVLLYTRQRDYEQAHAILSGLQRKYPENYTMLMDLGALSLVRRRPNDAISAYNETLALFARPGRAPGGLERAAVLNQLGKAHRQKGDLAAASRILEEAIAQGRSSQRAVTLAHLELGKTLDLLDRREQAVNHYRTVAAAPDVAGSRQEAESLLRKPWRGND